MRSWVSDGAIRFAVPTTFLLCWESLSLNGVIPLDTFSRPSQILTATYFGLQNGEILHQSLQTLSAALIAVIIAFLIAFPIGVITGISFQARMLSNFTIGVLRSVPPVALIPIVIMIFGFGLWTDVTVPVWSCVWIILIAISSAVKLIDARTMEVSRLLEFSFFNQVVIFALPSMLGPTFLTLRVALSTAFVMVVTCEIAANPRGLGYGMMQAQQSLQADLMYAMLLWLALLGWAIDRIMRAISRRLVFWV